MNTKLAPHQRSSASPRLAPLDSSSERPAMQDNRKVNASVGDTSDAAPAIGGRTSWASARNRATTPAVRRHPQNARMTTPGPPALSDQSGAYTPALSGQ